jgi:hypothetical protein
MRFIPGLKLSEAFYREAVAPILRRHFPGMTYSAGLLGDGSEVLGLDDLESTDHHWGPRVLLFLSKADYRRRKEISGVLGRELPTYVCGYSTNFSPPDPNDSGVRQLRPVDAGPVNHMVEMFTIESFLRRELRIGSYREVSAKQWLAFPSQSLLEVTSGAVFHDGLGELNRMRRQLSFYPRRVWLGRMEKLWGEIGQEEAFVGRTGMRGDEAGSKLIAARQVQRMMELGFLIERRYAPYSKWFGAAFAKLRIGRKLGPGFARVWSAKGWRERESALSRAYEAMARAHNELRVTEPVDAKVSRYHGRPYRVIHADRIAKAIRAAIS